MRWLAGSALIAVVLVGGSAYAGPSEEEKIEAVIAGLIDAYRNGDAAAMSRYYAPEVTVVPSDYTPAVSGWANVEARYRQAYANLSGAEMVRENTHVERRGNLAWAFYQWRFAGVAGQRTIGTQGHTTLVLEKRGGKWVIVHNHTSAIVPPSEAEQTTPPQPSS